MASSTMIWSEVVSQSTIGQWTKRTSVSWEDEEEGEEEEDPAGEEGMAGAARGLATGLSCRGEEVETMPLLSIVMASLR